MTPVAEVVIESGSEVVVVAESVLLVPRLVLV